MGSGTTLFECENLDRKYIGIDINEEIVKYVSSKMQKSDKQFFEILEFDSANSTLFMEKISNSLANLGENSAKFALFHPPYMDIVKFTDKNENLFGISDLKEFLGAFLKVVSNTLEFLEKNRYFAVVIGILYKNSEILPLGFYVIHYIKLKFKVKLKGVIVKNIEENRGKLKSGEIWTYRALRSDYYIFKHEYILVFKKEFWWKKRLKQKLFLELAKPDENGVSRWVNIDEFVGKFSDLQLVNGGSWCRKSSSLAKKFIVEFDKTQTKGNTIDRIRLNGKNENISFNQHIRSDIKNFYKDKNCVMLGIRGNSKNTKI